jgi:hypothetical protein
VDSVKKIAIVSIYHALQNTANSNRMTKSIV